jgi:hypothetical protein
MNFIPGRPQETRCLDASRDNFKRSGNKRAETNIEINVFLFDTPNGCLHVQLVKTHTTPLKSFTTLSILTNRCGEQIESCFLHNCLLSWMASRKRQPKTFLDTLRVKNRLLCIGK